ncbi:NUDIX domain-containing protein [Pseudohalioglobus sediminis]|uniref:8-oxo-dGTP diphosphatase n=1 Tax=Pseudohalioglobus sediminis TaxID=2606449 RepID=A0A5B0WPU0_9GAMM|nr:NUDIX domain-containing protein [Pseudohalioglobus sediminis]KAA1189114.1 NUDIX domain-containing protein [Pseudohalioglobus sediminis]
MDAMKTVIQVTAAVIVRDGKVLAARRGPGKHLEGYWEFPGGKLEENESPESCLERELAEEFSISSKIGEYIGESVYDYGEKVVRLLGYEVEHTAGKFELVDHDELRWLKMDQLTDVKWAPADIPLVEQYEAWARTAGYYSTSAVEYCRETSEFDIGDLYRPFLKHLSPVAHILDLGCGSGRDSKAFREMGHNVTGVDGNAEIAAWASVFTGHPVEVKSFQQLDYKDEFDAVWASASLLHCPETQLKDVIQKILAALKDQAIAYMSFKWGESPSVDERGRYFTNQTTQSLGFLLESIQDTEILELWDAETTLRDKPQRWVYAIVRKRGGQV